MRCGAPGPTPRRLPSHGNDAVYFYTRDVPAAEACDLQARMFHPGSSGLSEDPATGSATVAAAALLADLAGERDGESKLRIGQGVDMNRPSLLLTRVRKANGVVMSAHVGGACVQMMEGTFRLAGEGGGWVILEFFRIRPTRRSSFRGARSARPESITTTGSMDSGPAPNGASRNDGFYVS